MKLQRIVELRGDVSQASHLAWRLAPTNTFKPKEEPKEEPKDDDWELNVDERMFNDVGDSWMDNVSDPDSDYNYNRYGGLQPQSLDYSDPDTFWEPGSTTVIYSENGHLICKPFGNTHTDILSTLQNRPPVFAGTEYEDQVGKSHSGVRWYRMGEKVALLGRISDNKEYISFWNMDEQQIGRLLGPCIERLLQDGIIGPDTLVMAPPLDDVVKADQVGSAKTHELSAKEAERIEMMQQIHLARDDRKRALLKKAGVGVAPMKQHKLSHALRDRGLLAPGQKWWGTEGFAHRLSSIVGKVPPGHVSTSELQRIAEAFSASRSRVMHHTLPGRAFGIITAFRGNLDRAENNRRNQALRDDISQAGYWARPVKGGYIEQTDEGELLPVQEDSFFVFGDDDDQKLYDFLYAMIKKYNQDAAMFKPAADFGKVEAGHAALIGNHGGKLWPLGRFGAKDSRFYTGLKGDKPGKGPLPRSDARFVFGDPVPVQARAEGRTVVGYVLDEGFDTTPSGRHMKYRHDCEFHGLTD